MKSLALDIVTLQAGFWPSFYIALFALCTFGNAGFMREKMCTHICPYSRFQSSMFDSNTTTVTYNSGRGEGRGPRPRSASKRENQNKGLGDCIDCGLCVQVCPAGIDIRDGLQYECINCGACVDACDGVMSKMRYEKGLISFTSQSKLQGESNTRPRAKILGYSAVLLVMCGLLIADLATRSPLNIDIIRDRGALYRETNEGFVENVYTLVILNKSQQTQEYKVSLDGLEIARFDGAEELSVKANELARFPLSVAVNPEFISERVTGFSIEVTDSANNSVSEEITFLYR